jgi:RNA polymerase sigma-70 factor (ECF subfamily)
VEDGQDQRYLAAVAAHGPALERLARAYEADADQRDELLQEIHVALWRSLAAFDGRCSLRTWVYRVAHNASASHVLRRKRARSVMKVSLDDLALTADDDPERTTGDKQILERLMRMISDLKQPDAQVMLLYLEDLDAAAIGEVTGLSPGAVATKIHRIKAIFARRFQGGPA